MQNTCCLTPKFKSLIVERYGPITQATDWYKKDDLLFLVVKPSLLLLWFVSAPPIYDCNWIILVE